jgi:hypothetical protein
MTAVEIVKENLQKQNDDLKDRLRQRKLGKLRRQKCDKTVASPNLSKSEYLGIVDHFTVEMAPDASDSIMEQSDPSGMLEGLNDDIDNDQMPSDEELDGDDDPELLAELERRQESIVEEFLEIAYAAKHERVE